MHRAAPRPFNADARPGLGPALSAAYEKYCELPTTDKSSGPSQERGAEYRIIYSRLVASGNYPTYREIWSKENAE